MLATSTATIYALSALGFMSFVVLVYFLILFATLFIAVYLITYLMKPAVKMLRQWEQ